MQTSTLGLTVTPDDIAGPDLFDADSFREPAVRRSVREAAPVKPLQTWYLPVKRLFDVLAVLVLIVPAGPIILLAVSVTRLTSKGPVFYRQTRLGCRGRPFRLCKIRTMVADAEASTGAVWAQQNDPRITRFGAFLRASHIDEFPQLVHVLTGDMSLIGPRPERPEFVERLQWQVPRYTERMAVRPGVTGLAQLLLPPDSGLEDVKRKVEHDLYYIRHLSPWLDAKVLAHTAWLLATTVGRALVAPLRLPRVTSVDGTSAGFDG